MRLLHPNQNEEAESTNIFHTLKQNLRKKFKNQNAYDHWNTILCTIIYE